MLQLELFAFDFSHYVNNAVSPALSSTRAHRDEIRPQWLLHKHILQLRDLIDDKVTISLPGNNCSVIKFCFFALLMLQTKICFEIRILKNMSYQPYRPASVSSFFQKLVPAVTCQ